MFVGHSSLPYCPSSTCHFAPRPIAPTATRFFPLTHAPLIFHGCAPSPKLIDDLSFFCELAYIFKFVGSRAGRTLYLIEGMPMSYATPAMPYRSGGYQEPSSAIWSIFESAKQRLSSEGWSIFDVLSGQAGSTHSPILSHEIESDPEVGYIALNTLNPSKPTAVVVFRGTITERESFASERLGPDWATNIDAGSLKLSELFPEYRGEKMFVHRGFAAKLHSVQMQLTQNIDALLKLYPNIQLIVTGHSQGGAVAQIAMRHTISVLQSYWWTRGKRFHNGVENQVWGFFISPPAIFNPCAAKECERVFGLQNVLSVQGEADPVAKLLRLLPIFKGTGRRCGIGTRLVEPTKQIKERAAASIPNALRTPKLLVAHYTIKDPARRETHFDSRLVPKDLRGLEIR